MKKSSYRPLRRSRTLRRKTMRGGYRGRPVLALPLGGRKRRTMRGGLWETRWSGGKKLIPYL